ncbi:hypothetical protein Y032_0099g3207 [Ancylostoma ceylanicum]|uniref:Zinc metalloproteinase n=1 Tax=Ancylostoma ceylanicum TaxID=53326 RepID=A0A016TI55_9BILA|nr:hypothetical protein Y032_0099g3207 [Ancylostoma ceylanicum]
MSIRRSFLYITILGISIVNANSESAPLESLKRKLKELDGSNNEQGVRRFVTLGDILLTRDEARELIEDEEEELSRHKRQAQRRNASNENLWVDGVKYVFDPNASQKLKDGFTLAVNAWQKDTCINFTLVQTREEVKGEDYLYVTTDETDPKGCLSHVGKLGGYQPIFLGDGCESFPHAAHEVGHALGMYHTQTRHDRDKYIHLKDDNIEEEYKEQYLKLTEEKNENYGFPYDYGSIMHYGSSVENPWMVPFDANYKTTMGSPFISFIDLFMMNTHYNCTEGAVRHRETGVDVFCCGISSCGFFNSIFHGDLDFDSFQDICDPKTSAQCENGGFPHPRKCDECICPGGYGGALCNQRPQDCADGKTLEASDGWKSLEANIHKTKDDGTYATCTYWITAPDDKKIEIEIESINTKEPTIGCAKGGVEIKANENHTLTGYRYCVDPAESFKIKSHSNRVPVILYTGVPLFWTTVELRYHAVIDLVHFLFIQSSLCS